MSVIFFLVYSSKFRKEKKLDICVFDLLQEDCIILEFKAILIPLVLHESPGLYLTTEFIYMDQHVNNTA